MDVISHRFDLFIILLDSRLFLYLDAALLLLIIGGMFSKIQSVAIAELQATLVNLSIIHCHSEEHVSFRSLDYAYRIIFRRPNHFVPAIYASSVLLWGRGCWHNAHCRDSSDSKRIFVLIHYIYRISHFVDSKFIFNCGSISAPILKGPS